jgi:uncharacterized protein YkwD
LRFSEADGVRLGAIGAACAAGLLWVLPGPAAAQDTFEDGVLAEINFARTHPQAFARALEAAREEPAPWVGDEPGAVEEAVAFLMRQPPLPPLRYDERLEAAARLHATAQGGTGQEGHVGPRGETFPDRLRQAGMYAGVAAENISYGQWSAEDVVRQLVVDSGVRDRGHRQDIFGHAYQAVGVGCGDHSRYGSMCVIEYAGAIVQR